MVRGVLEVVLRRAGVKLGPRRLGTCALCYAAVFDDDRRRLYRGELVHADCVRYCRRR